MSNYSLNSPINVSSSSVAGQVNMYGAGGSFAVQVKAPTLAANVDFTLPSTTGTAGQLVRRINATSTGWSPSPAIGATTGKSLPIHFNFCTTNIPSTPINAFNTGGATLAYFMYNGSTLSGPPTKLSIIYSASGTGPARVTIFDVNTSLQFGDSGILSNGTTKSFSSAITGTVPTTQSLMRISSSPSNVGSTFTIYSIIIS